VGLAVGVVGVALLCGLELSGSRDTLLGAAMLLLGRSATRLAFPGQESRSRHDAGRRDHGRDARRHRRARPARWQTLPERAPGAGPLAAAIALGAISGGLGWLMYYTVLAESGPAKSAVALYLVPAFAVIYGVVLLGERVTPAAIAGLAIVVSGSWLAASQGRR
jgi:hypothetical protein